MRPDNVVQLQPNPPVDYVAFRYQHFHNLSQNEYTRYARNSERVSYAVEMKSRRNGQITWANQYPVALFQKPDGFAGEGDPAPTVVPVTDLVAVVLPNGEIGMQGNFGAEKMNARRRYHFSICRDNQAEEEYTFYPLSPLGEGPAFFGPTPIRQKFNDTKEADELKTKPFITKEDGDLIVKNSDVPLRALQKTRNPDQKSVMGGTAVDFYKDCIARYSGSLSVELVQLLERSSNVMHLQTLHAKDRRGEQVDPSVRRAAYADRFLRPELLHRKSYTLHPMHIDPQRKDNLGAARLCHNTAMMVLERTVKWFATQIQSSENRLNCKFDMLLDTEVIDYIHFLVVISFGNIKIKIKQEIDALEKNSEYTKASDLAGLVGTLTQLVNSVQPTSAEPILIRSSLDALKSKRTLFRRRERDESEPPENNDNNTARYAA